MAKNVALWAGLLLPFAVVGGKEKKNEREGKKGGGWFI